MSNLVKTYFRHSIDRSVKRLGPKESSHVKGGAIKHTTYYAEKYPEKIDARKTVEGRRIKTVNIVLTGESESPEVNYTKMVDTDQKVAFDGTFEEITTFQAGRLALSLSAISHKL